MKWILFICLLLTVELYGQHKSAYLMDYNWITGVKDTLPAWVVAPQDSMRFVGVSDPGLHPSIAQEQALLRAWMLFQLNRGVTISLLTDYYTQNETDRNYDFKKDKLITLATLECSNKSAVSFRVARKYISQYGECFLEVCPIESSVKTEGIYNFIDTLNSEILGEVMLVSNSELREKQEIRVHWTISYPQACMTESYFILRGNNEFRALTRRIDNFKQPRTNSARYWYQNTNISIEQDATESPLSDAFWCASAESMLYSLMSHSFTDLNIKTLEEKYKEITRGLKRESIRTSISFSIKQMSIVENKLYVDWSILNLPSNEAQR